MTLLLLAGLLVSSTSPAQPTPNESQLPETTAQLDQLETQLTRLNALGRTTPEAEGDRLAALLYRRDERALDLLHDFVSVAEGILRLAEDSADQAALAERLALYNDSIDEGFSARLHRLEQRIDAQLLRIESLDGVDRINAEAQVESLNDQRLRYLETMIDIVRIRQKLAFPAGRFESVALNSLLDYAEELMGTVELRAATRGVLDSQLAKAGENADLKAGLAIQQHSIERAAAQLDRVVLQLERLGVDTSRQRRVLLKQASSVSVSLVDADLVSLLWEEIGSTFERWMRTQAVDVTAQTLLFIIIVVLARLLARFARAAVERTLNTHRGNMSTLLRDVLVSLTGGLILTIGVLIALAQVGISVAPMLAGLGVAGFIIGFALQDVLGNFAAGAMILAYRPFDTEDYIRVADVEGYVKKMNMVSTTIVTIDNQTLIIPNSKIWGDVIRNYTGQRVRRVDLEFGISYADSIEKAERILHEVLKEIPAVLKSPEPIIRVHRLGNSSVDFVVRPWVRTEDYWETHWAVIKAVKLRFDAEGITIPFPQRDIHHYYPDAKTAP